MSLDLARERSVDSVLQRLVNNLASRPAVALARIWMVQPGGDEPLHLVASAGHSKVDLEADWSAKDAVDPSQSEPLATRIWKEARGIEVPDLETSDLVVADPEWIEREGIRGFSGRPIAFMGEIFGVLTVFTRIPFAPGSLMWLSMLGDQAAAAISNARAFEEIERLNRKFELENAYLREEVREAHAFGDIIGVSSALKSVLERIELVAPTDASVLILGESGTGKELVAREIHKRSGRSGKALVRVNCASVPRELYESEFFGHAKGAFTGAVRDRTGRFQLADGGTLFLDEVGEIPLELQSKLLRVLQEGQYERVGEERTREVDVRIIAATNRDLEKEVEEGRFREDLYYRLNVVPIEVVPLRRRREDIPLLAAHFLDQAAQKLGRKDARLTQAAVLDLQAYPWPGNVRELQNVIERALITTPHGALLRLDLPTNGNGQTPAAPAHEAELEVVPDAEMKRRERANLEAALKQTNWKIYGEGGAAELLGVKPTTVASRVKKLGLAKPTS